MSEFVVESTVKARPGTVFDVYTDHRDYANLVGLVRAAELEREGEPPPNGLGAIRRLHLVGATVREEVTGYERPYRYSYRMLSGAPVDQYTSAVTFTPTDHGTAVAYSVSVVPSHRMLPVQFPTEEFVRVFMRQADAEAERID
jgi:Polyketide cyclase / dehydrase and lipid transport